jgi:hypothetical protein
MSEEALRQLAEQRRHEAAQRRFVDSFGYAVVRVQRIRCPNCQAIAQGRPQHSERHGTLSIQRRKCHVCETIFVALVD